MDAYESAAAVLKALAHPVRLQIVQLLAEQGPACVCHLEASLGQRQAYISQQLATLRAAGLVVDRREGLNVFYSLVPANLPALIGPIKDVASRLAEASGGDLEGWGNFQHPSMSCACPDCVDAPVGAAC